MQENHHQETHRGKSSKHRPSAEIVPVVSSNTYTDHAHQLQIWLDLPTAREQRRFLESHCYLLNEHSETILQDLLIQEPTDAALVKQRREVLLLLQV